MSVVEGIDIGDSQPNVDWRKIAAAVGFAAIKVTEGRDFIAKSFTSARVKAAEEALGKNVVYYHFARADTPSLDDARNECRDFIAALKSRGARIGRNLVLDYEREVAGNGNDTAWIGAWVAELRKLAGHRPWIYGGSTLRDEGVSENFGCPLWLPVYGVSDPDPFVPAPWRGSRGPRMRVWQYTDHGTCAGVPGPVDRNRFFGTPAELRRFLA